MTSTSSDPLDPFDLALVGRLARLAGETEPSRLRLLSHVVRAAREGHACLSPELYALVAGVTVDDAVRAVRDVEQSRLVASTGASMRGFAPFVLDRGGRLYLHRHFSDERALARSLLALATASPADEGAVDPTLLDALFPPRSDGSDDLQRLAAVHACAAPLTVIAGGPGTGKTSTVVKVLALLAERALRRGVATPRTLLLAPTGKAAARLGESIRGAIGKLPLSSAVRGAIPQQASTIHRALGTLPDGKFRRGRDMPLDADVVLVDEASMVGLGLMRALLEAVSPGAKVVLLGDRNQLASVEAGSVLADLCDAAERRDSPLAGVLRPLVESHRFHAESGIGMLARAIEAGDAAEALRILEDPAVPDVSRGEPVPAYGRIPAGLQRAAREGYAGLAEGAPRDRIAALGRYRTLTAMRRGPLGVAELGARMARSLGRGLDPHTPGTPLLVLANDADADLWNGDVGVVAPGPSSAPCAWFDAADAPRAVSLHRLPAHEACWAMSIHKSQGSEFDVVSVVLPEESALSSRELLYTAATRARTRVVVHATPEAITRCVARRVVRASGLADALLEQAENPPGGARDLGPAPDNEPFTS